MKSTRPVTTVERKVETAPASFSIFDRANLLWMAAGVTVMIIGFLLMAGGRSEDPNVFNPKEVYSTTRITIAPILILAGLVVLIIALFRQPKNS